MRRPAPGRGDGARLRLHARFGLGQRRADGEDRGAADARSCCSDVADAPSSAAGGGLAPVERSEASWVRRLNQNGAPRVTKRPVTIQPSSIVYGRQLQ